MSTMYVAFKRLNLACRKLWHNILDDLGLSRRYGVPKWQPVEFYPLPGYGEHMTKEKFIQHCGALVDYDGYGELATKDSVAHGEEVHPSWVQGGLFRWPKWATHVVWYNR